MNEMSWIQGQNERRKGLLVNGETEKQLKPRKTAAEMGELSKGMPNNRQTKNPKTMDRAHHTHPRYKHFSSETWTRPPTSNVISDFWNLFNFAKPDIVKKRQD